MNAGAAEDVHRLRGSGYIAQGAGLSPTICSADTRLAATRFQERERSLCCLMSGICNFNLF